jgi:stage V sporulation protein AC
MNKEQYKRFVRSHAKKSPIAKNCIRAFLVGGIICTIAQALRNIYQDVVGMAERDAAALTSVSICFIAISLTAIGIFDKIAKFAGAGTLVPVTGFSNAVVSEAMDAKSEGMVLGVGSKIFTVAGPVIIYGLLSGVIYGVIYYVYSTFITTL